MGYTIAIKNASNSNQRFILIEASSKPSGIPSDDVVSSSPTVPNGTNIQFTMENKFYAICGTSTSTANNNIGVTTMLFKEVELGPRGSFFCLTADDGVSPRWDDDASKGKSTDAPGYFTLRTDATFKFPNDANTYFGVAKKDPKTNDIISIQTSKAMPNMSSQFCPRIKYYIAVSSSAVGSSVDLQTLTNVLWVDFSTASMRQAEFILNADGTYEMTSSAELGVKWGMGL